MWRKMNLSETEMDIALKSPKVQWIFIPVTFDFLTFTK